MSDSPSLVLVIGSSNSGKTTLIEQLVSRLSGQGLKLGTIKHATHRLDVDREGKDTWRHRQAGALCTVGLSPDALFSVQTIDADSPAPGLRELADRMFLGLDMVLVEGFHREALPRIEVLNPDSPTRREPPEGDAELIATVSGKRSGDRIHFSEEELEMLTEVLAGRART